jgi:anti-sigma regulatory factor (Ser/Thr protein kinase)
MERPLARLNLNAATQWITAAALQHPDRLAAEMATRFGVSRPTARRKLARLVELNWLTSLGTPRRPLHRPGALRQIVRRYALQGLREDLPWAQDFAPCFTLPAAVQRMVQHAFCELLNNAIDHSGGTQVTVSLRQTGNQVQLLVSDDGRGLFRQIADTFAITDPQLAMLEISKGKLTSQPQSHTGQGLFFTSRLADVFDLHANERAFQQREWDGKGWHPQRALKHQGTSIYLSIALDTARTLDAVRKAYSADGESLGFERTVVQVGLLASASIGLESRAQARRVAARLHDFDRADIDFGGVADIGHGFADELFRVMTREQPGLALNAMNMSPAVAAMIASVRQSA